VAKNTVKIVQYSTKLKIELMEEYSEAKIYKSKPELRNSNVNADYFYSSSEIFESVANISRFARCRNLNTTTRIPFVFSLLFKF